MHPSAGMFTSLTLKSYLAQEQYNSTQMIYKGIAWKQRRWTHSEEAQPAMSNPVQWVGEPQAVQPQKTGTKYNIQHTENH